MPHAETGKFRRLAEVFVLSAPLFGAAAFGLVEYWSRWLFLIWALIPAFLLRPALDVRWGVFLGVGIIALLQSLRPWSPDAPSMLFGTADATLSVYAASGWVSAALLAGAACSLQDKDPDFIRRLAYSIAGTAILVAAVGLIQMAEGNAAIYGIRVVMSAVYPFAGFYNRNHAACFMGVGAILAMGLYLEHRPVGFGPDAWAKRVTLAFPILFLWAAIWATESRGALAILFVAVVLLLQPRLSLLFGIGSAAAGWAVINSSLPQRVEIYRSTLMAVWDRWPLGWGAGAFAVASPVYMSRAIDGRVPHAHSDWLQFMLEFGMPAGLFLSAVTCVALQRTVVGTTGLRRAFGAAAAFVLLHAGVESPLFAGANLAILALCAASFPTHGLRLPSWTKAAALAAAAYALAAGSPAAVDSFGRLTTAAYFASDSVADDLTGAGGGRELISRYSDPARDVWDARRSRLRAQTLSSLGRRRDAEGELARRNMLSGGAR